MEMTEKRIGLDELRLDLDYSNDGKENVGDVLKRLEFQRLERLSIVPTDDEEVRACLKLLGEQVIRFGEDNAARRERLSELLFKNEHHMSKFRESPYSMKNEITQEGSQQSSEEEEEEFYTPANESLISARQFLIQYSLNNAHERLRLQTERAKDLDVQKEILYRRELNKSLKKFELSGSQLVSSRPVSQVAISSDDSMVATCSWGGDLKILSTETLEIIKAFDTAHDSKIGGVDWNPDGTALVTGAANGEIRIWNLNNDSESPAGTLTGHENRVARVRFHPSGKYVASASFDMTWRLWDVEKQIELQLQEGHAKEVYCVAFQKDGSLLCSTGLDSVGLVWDLRSGKSIMALEGHTKPIYGLDWSPNGYEIATGSADGTIRLWDVRKVGILGALPAHNSIVSEVKFDKANGHYLVSSSYDKTLNIYSGDNWTKLSVIQGHTDKILSVDISTDGSHLFSSGWDRSLKQWSLKIS